MAPLKFSDLVTQRVNDGNVTNNEDDTLKCCLTSSTVIPSEFNNKLDALAVTGSKYDADYVTGCGQDCQSGDTAITYAKSDKTHTSCSVKKGKIQSRAYCMRGKEGENNRWYWATDFNNNAKVCPRDYREYSSATCQAKIETFCKKDSNLFKSECQQYCAANPSKCISYKSSYCNSADRKDDANCISWCLSKDGQGNCDMLFRERCSDENKDKDNPECYCIFSSVKKYNPFCVDAKCANQGYVTANMTTQKCPDITDCSVYNEFGVQGNVEWKDNTVIQKCSGQSSTTNVGNKDDDSAPTPSTDSSPSPTPTPTPTPTPSKDEKTKQLIMWVGIGLGVFVLLIIILLFSGKKSSPSPYYR